VVHPMEGGGVSRDDLDPVLLLQNSISPGIERWILVFCRPGISVGIASDYGLDGPGIESRWGEIFLCPDWPWGLPSLLYNGYRVFPGGKVRLGRAADHSPPSNATVKKG
jgi:hypothetical protein